VDSTRWVIPGSRLLSRFQVRLAIETNIARLFGTLHSDSPPKGPTLARHITPVVVPIDLRGRQNVILQKVVNGILRY
jgi:hypothetical protein